ncbi:MAG: hypothetical protein OXF04_04510, partial [bacterium]|nr:hypothetical protein [bacterium]
MWDDYRGLITPARLAMAGAGLAIAVGVAAYLVVGANGTPRPEAVIPMAAPSTASPTPAGDEPLILVHAAGAVNNPGV